MILRWLLISYIFIMYLFVIHLTILSISTLPISFLGTLIIFRLNITPCCQTFFCLAKKKNPHFFCFLFLQFSYVSFSLYSLQLFTTSLIQMSALNWTMCVLIYNSICFVFSCIFLFAYMEFLFFPSCQPFHIIFLWQTVSSSYKSS